MEVRMLNDRYRLDEILGEGGMGVVYRAHDTMLERDVAVKLVSRDVLGTSGSARLLNEARTVAKFDHPNIVGVFDAGEYEGSLFLVMQLVRGKILKDYHPSSLEETLHITRQICAALHHSHEHGIIHRDLKPENVMIMNDRTVKLMDFGIAHNQVARLTIEGEILGTISYMAPEQAMGKEPSPQTDLYALGVMLYEVVTGELPFSAGNPFAIMTQHLHKTPIPPRKRDPEIPAELEALIMKMLNKEPADRPASANEVDGVLSALVSQGLVTVIESTADPGLQGKDQGISRLPVTYTTKTSDKEEEILIPTNLHTQVTLFIGREKELAALDELLTVSEHRMVTIVGAGGMGKTRLAIALSDRLLHRFGHASRVGDKGSYKDGIYFVPMASIRSAEFMVSTIFSAMHPKFAETNDSKVNLMNYLRAKEMLLVLDNFEHLLEKTERGSGVDLLADILQAAPGVKFLVTSRERLKLYEEQVFAIRGLEYPRLSEEKTSLDPRYLKEFTAVKLFLRSAKRAQYSFDLVEDDLTHISRICEFLEGMPLGLELAAGWVDTLSLGEIADEIHKNLEFLATEMHNVPVRHRSMTAVFDTSWQGLSRSERQVFKKLSVFRGGFTRQASEEIAGATVRNLAKLISKSFLHRHLDTGRYKIHEALRQYGLEQLRKTPGLEDATRDRHCEHFSTFMDQPWRNTIGARVKETVKAIEADIDNVREAWDWAVKNKKINDLHKAMQTMYIFSWHRSLHQEGEQAFREMIAALREMKPTTERDIALGYGLSFLGLIMLWTGRLHLAKELVKESLSTLRPLDAPFELAGAIFANGWVALAEGDMQRARAFLMEIVPFHEENSQYEMLGLVYTFMGNIAHRQYDYTESKGWYQKALSLARKTNDHRTMTDTLSDLGRVNLDLGEYAEAEQNAQKSLVVARAHEITPMIISALRLLGQVAEATGEFERAEAFLQESLAAAREWGKKPTTTWNLICLANVFTSQGKQESATMLYQEAQGIVPGDDRLQLQLLAGMGRLAFRSRDYNEAQRLHEESLVLSMEQSDRANVSRNHAALGRIALALSHDKEARDHFKAALEESVATGAPPLILDSISGIANLFAQEGDPEQAIHGATLVKNHPASHAETKERATDLLKRLEADLPPDDFAASVEQPQPNDLTTVAKSLIA